MTRAWIFVAISIAVSGSASAANSLSVKTFFKPAEFSALSLSPDGSHLGALVHSDGARHLVVMNVDSGNAGSLTNKMEYEVEDYFWIDNERLHFSVISDRDKDSKEFSHLGDYVIRRDGSKYWPSSIRGRLLSRLPDDSKNVLVSGWDRRRGYPEVWLASIKKRGLKRVQGNPFNVYRWFADANHRVRVGLDDVQGTDSSKILYRADEKAEWKHVLDIADNEYGFAGFDRDGRHLLIWSNVDTDRNVIQRFDPDNGERKEILASDPEFGVGSVSFSHGKKTPMYAHNHADIPRHIYFDTEWESILSSIDKALSKTHNDIIDASDDEQRLLVHAWSDINPGDYYLFDRGKRDLKYLVSARSWIEPDDMATMDPIRYTARDGETIHGYLTLPPGSKKGVAVPLILSVHGGPYGIREVWGFDPEYQFLASRGYAVLNANYRGSGGYGKRFEKLGYKQWGLTMQDDLTDAVLWAIDEGIADPEKICIMGASYGGYAAMMGLVKTPELYKCAVNFVGVTDLFELHENDTRTVQLPGRHDSGKRWFHKTIGDASEDRERFIATSPARHVEKIQAPVFLAHGYYDGRVDVHDHFYKLMRQLKKHDKPFVSLLEKNEGHGIFFHDNRVEYYEAIELFLAENLH